MVKILAVIPARGGSKRLPRKNVLPFHGRPLVQWSVIFACSTGLFDRVVISTDDTEILAAATQAGAVSFGLRPDALSHDTATAVDVVLHELALAEAADGEYDYVALLQPTTPFRQKQRWQDAVSLLERNAETPSVIGVAPINIEPYHMLTITDDQKVSPLFPDHLQQRTQDLPKAVVINGSLYLVRCDALKSDRTFFFNTSLAVLCDDPRENIDIDTRNDFEQAEQTLATALAGIKSSVL